VTEITLSTDAGDRIIDVPQDEIIRVMLPESPTTGYQWHIDIPQTAGVELLGSDYSSNQDTRLGGRGTRIFELRANAPGTTDVQFEMRRAWETSIAPAQRLRLTIHVRPER
jgi:predicted secreted protein